MLSRLQPGTSVLFTDDRTGLWDMDFEADYAPEPDGRTHYHLHSTDGLHCYGDSELSTTYAKLGQRPGLTVVELPYCIYPCHVARAAQRDRNIEILGEWV
jgi:hypothetical protein